MLRTLYSENIKFRRQGRQVICVYILRIYSYALYVHRHLDRMHPSTIRDLLGREPRSCLVCNWTDILSLNFNAPRPFLCTRILLSRLPCRDGLLPQAERRQESGQCSLPRDATFILSLLVRTKFRGLRRGSKHQGRALLHLARFLLLSLFLLLAAPRSTVDYPLVSSLLDTLVFLDATLPPATYSLFPFLPFHCFLIHLVSLVAPVCYSPFL